MYLDIKYGPELEKNYVSLVVDPEVYEHIHAHLYGHTHTDSFRFHNITMTTTK